RSSFGELFLVAFEDFVDDAVDFAGVIRCLLQVEVPIYRHLEARLDVARFVAETEKQPGAIFDLFSVHGVALLGGAPESRFRLLVSKEHGRYLTRSAVDE